MGEDDFFTAETGAEDDTEVCYPAKLGNSKGFGPKLI